MAIKNNFIGISYKLYVKDTDEFDEELAEQCSEQEPYRFISQLGAVLPAFENQLDPLSVGDRFDFVIPCAEAYGEFQDELMFDVPKSVFERDGKFDSKFIYEGNVVQLQDNDGQQFNATIIEVKSDAVTIDLNHPRAGQDLHFVGKVLEHREATAEEITALVNIMSGACGGGCGGCGGGDCQSGGCQGGCGGCC